MEKLFLYLQEEHADFKFNKQVSEIVEPLPHVSLERKTQASIRSGQNVQDLLV